jgi:hypothetical protein
MLVLQMGGFMKCAVEMGSGGIIYVPSFIKIGSGIQKFKGRAHTKTHKHTDSQTAR